MPSAGEARHTTCIPHCGDMHASSHMPASINPPLSHVSCLPITLHFPGRSRPHMGGSCTRFLAPGRIERARTPSAILHARKYRITNTVNYPDDYCNFRRHNRHTWNANHDHVPSPDRGQVTSDSTKPSPVPRARPLTHSTIVGMLMKTNNPRPFSELRQV